ncbi:MAG: LCP family protein [Clostridia bacterium]
MKIKHNNNAFFKAVTLISIIASLVVGLIFFTQNVEKASFLDDFSSNSYQYTSYSSSVEPKEIFQNGQWYVEKTNLSTWLLLGLDKTKDELLDESDTSSTQADFIFLVVFDEENKTFNTVQINRDTMVDIDVFSLDNSYITGSVFAQITLAHAYGADVYSNAENVARAVSRLMYDTQIDNYVSFTLDIVPTINDLVGGVELEVLYDYSRQYPEMIVGETVNLSGEQALSYVQQRIGIDEQTNEQRMQRQTQYLEALQETIENKRYDSGFTYDLLTTAADYIYTDASFSTLQSMLELYSEFEYISNYTLEGETIQSQQFMEFHAYEDELINLVLNLFYTAQ